MLMMMINIIILLLFLPQAAYSQENDIDNEDEYYKFRMAEGITIYGDRSSTETKILSALNGSLSNRKNFIENNLLEDAGFRRTGNVRHRKTDASEKGLSILHGVGALLSFGLIPTKPFFEIDYAKLPKGRYYSFESVIVHSELKNISLDVFNVLKLEYMLQIEFANGIVIEDTLNYYTEENIKKIENLVERLPDFPESIAQIKERYLNIELPKIKRAINQYNNPSENYLRALENFKRGFGKQNEN
jgi:hypothetical protein